MRDEIKNLKIIAMNTNKLTSHEKKIDFVDLLKEEQPDIVLISEKGKYPIRWTVDKYTIHNEIRSDIRNSTAIFIKSDIKHTIVFFTQTF